MRSCRGREERLEEAQALDVVHVKVGQKDVNFADVGVDTGAETADAGPRIENEQLSAAAFNGDTGRVAAIADCGEARFGKRASRAPEADLHPSCASQNMATLPSQ
jgi:hypothetical protein